MNMNMNISVADKLVPELPGPCRRFLRSEELRLRFPSQLRLQNQACASAGVFQNFRPGPEAVPKLAFFRYPLIPVCLHVVPVTWAGR